MSAFDASMAVMLPTLLFLFAAGLFLLIRHIRENRDHYGDSIKGLWYRVDCLPFWPFKGHIQLGGNIYDPSKIYKRLGKLCLVSEPNGWIYIESAKTAIEAGVDPAGLCSSDSYEVRFLGNGTWSDGDVELRSPRTRAECWAIVYKRIDDGGYSRSAVDFDRAIHILRISLGDRIAQAFKRVVLETNEMHHLDPVNPDTEMRMLAEIVNANGEVVDQIEMSNERFIPIEGNNHYSNLVAQAEVANGRGEQISPAIPRVPGFPTVPATSPDGVRVIPTDRYTWQTQSNVVGPPAILKFRGNIWHITKGSFTRESDDLTWVINSLSRVYEEEAEAFREYFSQRRASVEPSVEPPNIIARRLGPNRWEASTAEHTAYLETVRDVVSEGSSYSWQIAGTKHNGESLPLHEGFFVKERAITAIRNIYGEQIAAALDRISGVDNQQSSISMMVNGNRFVVMDIQGREVVLEKMERESNPNETRWRVTFTGDQTNTIVQDSWTSRERALDFVRGCKGNLIANSLDEVSRPRSGQLRRDQALGRANRPPVSDDAADATALMAAYMQDSSREADGMLPVDFTDMSVAETIRELGRRERANQAANQAQIIVGSGGRRSMTVSELIAEGMLVQTNNRDFEVNNPASFTIPAKDAQRIADAQALSTEWHMREALSEVERVLADGFEPEDEDFAV